MSFNFGDYLIKNEKWLGAGDEAGGNHSTDGQLDDSEISVFFSASHFEIGSDSAGDATLSMDEFDNWYEKNTSAIEAFYKEQESVANMSDEDKKQAMLDSILVFINDNKNVVAKEHDGTPTLGNLDISNLKEEQPQDPPEDTPEIPPEDNPSSGTSLSDDAAKAIADALHGATEGKWGTDEKTVNKYLMNDEYSPEDILTIMNAYQDTYNHSLMTAIQGDYSGKAETALREKLYDSVAQIAQSKLGWGSADDIPEDIKGLTEHLHGKFSEISMLDYMCQFNKFDPDTKAQMLIAYEIMYPDEKDVLTQVTRRNWVPGDEDIYVNGMIESLRHVANS